MPHHQVMSLHSATAVFNKTSQGPEIVTPGPDMETLLMPLRDRGDAAQWSQGYNENGAR